MCWNKSSHPVWLAAIIVHGMHEWRRASRCPALAGAAFALLLGLGAGAAPAPRIVSAAGAGDRVIGVDDASDYPPAAAALPKLGEPAAVDLERLLRLQPTLVIVWDTGTPPRLRSELERLHLPVVAAEQRRLDDIGQALIDFGALAGTQPAAAAAAARYREELAALRTRYRGRRPLSVFYQVWDRPLYTLSGTHVVSEVLSLCGGRNVFAGLSTLAPAVDREAVVAANPQVILIGASGDAGARQAAEWARFPALQAVRAHHVYTVDPSLIGRMAPRILQGAREVCAALDAARGGKL